MSNPAVIDLWSSQLRKLAETGALAQAVHAVFGAGVSDTRLAEAIAAVAQGGGALLPDIQILPDSLMQGRLGAYAPSERSIYLNEAAAANPAVALQVLTHELGHHIANQYFAGRELDSNADDFVLQLLGKDQALPLAGLSPQHHLTMGELQLQAGQPSVNVLWFDTGLHIDWVQQQLPMLNARAFSLISLAQEDSDAFLGPLTASHVSPYGLQTHSATHFDNNNIRGSLEVMRKRWSDGIAQFQATSVEDRKGVPFRDASLVGRGFTGDTAGVENLIYRFGQITHAFQDFYSHSNWVELTRTTPQGWIKPNALLETSLGLPQQLNPGSYLPAASQVMVAMSGPDYGTMLKKVGVGYYPLPTDVYWWVIDRQAGWGQVFGNLLGGSGQSANAVAGLMTGAVNGAIYYDTDFSLKLRAVDRTGAFVPEYFNGFSHGGFAGALLGQWISPLSKDKPDNGRFADKAANAQFFKEAQNYADLQLREEWDRMGNLIFNQYGVAGLRKFAQYAVVETERERYVSTYNQPGARWKWDAVDNSLMEFAAVQAAAEAMSADSTSLELPLRQIEVFEGGVGATFITQANRSYLTQVWIDGRWLDSAAGVVDVHHDERADANAYRAAEIQHADRGARAMWVEPLSTDATAFGNAYCVEQVNPGVRVFINQFDVGHDEIHVVDRNAEVLKIIDVDEADYAELRDYLLLEYNIAINSRPEAEVLSRAKVLSTASQHGAIQLHAGDFFADADRSQGVVPSLMAGVRPLSFAAYDETLPWLSLRPDGTLEISDLSKVTSGVYEFYVSVTDGVSLSEGLPIVISVDPQIRIAGQSFAPTAPFQVDWHVRNASAVELFAQPAGAGYIYVPTASARSVAMRLGDAAGEPAGVDVDRVLVSLANESDSGEMSFFLRDYATGKVNRLEVFTNPAGGFQLRDGAQVVADITPASGQPGPAFLEEMFVPGMNREVLGVPLDFLSAQEVPSQEGRMREIELNVSVGRESGFAGLFGFYLVDLPTGNVIDPASGRQIENLVLGYENIDHFSVYRVYPQNGVLLRDSGSFRLDSDVSLLNTALLPYFKTNTSQGPQLFLGSNAGTEDGIAHVARLGANTFAVEELTRGDYDFDDTVVTVTGLTLIGSVDVVLPDHY